MEKIYYSKVGDSHNRNTSLAHAILNLINEDIMGLSKGKKEKQYLEVELKINGVEVKFSKFITIVDKQWDRMVKEEAKALVLKKVDNFYSKIYDTSNQIKQAMLRITRDNLGVTPTEDDRYF